jgi:hypothetical protein
MKTTAMVDEVGRITMVEASEIYPGGIEDMRRQLASCTQDLATMPKHKAGTEWHQDRVEEARWLTAAIERQTAARRARAEMN